MKCSTIFLLFLVAFFIAGNEEVTAQRYCDKGIIKTSPQCLRDECTSECQQQFGKDAHGLCDSNSCRCFQPC
ncbi:unnamed protein product [Linum trigynum]|uniref:Uncharacterized protein n=1 Tax=Linum trigynum TaxID=586398 RepID=A0AAV2D2P2_9ROSI